MISKKFKKYRKTFFSRFFSKDSKVLWLKKKMNLNFSICGKKELMKFSEMFTQPVALFKK